MVEIGEEKSVWGDLSKCATFVKFNNLLQAKYKTENHVLKQRLIPTFCTVFN